ncbi:Thioredoxin domain-containing protein 17 [Apophysomyces sp. BC1034]|nr:Thioredoxin domain-containing protein 17 [Apophysomyces sp. BC1015]KAG0183031.1 Thioredoxin domain-containing protein 17 [Apophysomyces sp. BC1021]KAG0194841.1 Thioredoxin domain-containing protein 17 [Apophysomyces sp. BC1034]
MRVIRVSVEDFDKTIEQELVGDNKVFVLFFGNEIPETSESWCRDCVVADPVIRKAILPVTNGVLIEAAVGLRNDWIGNKTNPYRVRFNVPAIPTLYKWTANGPGEHLIEDDCADIAKLEAFIQN